MEERTVQDRGEPNPALTPEQLRTIFDNLGDLMYIIDAEGTIVFSNSAVDGFLRTTPGGSRKIAEILKPWETRQPNGDLIPREDYAFARALRGEAVRDREVTVSHRETGYTREVRLSAFPIRDANGEVFLVVVTLHDLTASREALMRAQELETERIKQESERHFRTLWNAMDEGVVIHRLTYREGVPDNYVLLDVNRRYEEIVGIAREAVINRTASEVYGTPEAPYLKEFASVVQGNSPLHIEVFFEPLGKHFSISATPMGGDLFATIFFDVTEHKLLERIVTEREEQYRLTLECADIGVWVSNPATGSFTVSPTTCRLYGLPEATTWSRGMALRVLHPEDVAQVLADVDAALADPKVFESEHRTVWPDGSVHWLSSHGRALTDTHTGARRLFGVVEDVTEEKRVEQELRQSEEKFRKAFVLSPAAILITDIESGRLMDVNDAFTRVTGYRREEVVGLTTEELRFYQDPLQKFAFDERIRSEGGVRNQEFQFRKRNGAVGTAIGSADLIDFDGRRCLIASAVDISERMYVEETLKQTVATLTETEHRYRQLFASISDALYVYEIGSDGMPGKYLEVNEVACRMLGYSRAELLRLGPRDTVAPERVPFIPEFMRRLVTEKSLRWESVHLTKDGRRIPVENESRRFDLDGVPTIISSVRDIRKRKDAEEERLRLVTAIEQTGESIVVTDLDGNVQYCNPAFERITGYRKSEVLGQSTRVLKSGKHPPEFYAELWKTISSGEVWYGHLTNRKKDGTLFEEDATISAIRDAVGRISGYVAVKRDVTERLQLERQLAQAQKLESIGRLAGGVAHDFNNLLTVINGYGDFVLSSLQPEDPIYAHVQEIRKAGERAAALTQQLLAFSRKQTVEYKPLSLNAIVRDAEMMLDRLIGEDIQLVSDLDPLVGLVRAESNQMHQVVMNLVVNARDAMPDGGRLEINTTHVEFDAHEAAVHDVTPGPYICLSVADTGHGMDEETMRNVFEPFFTTKELGTGTGLGLSTVYGIVRQNGGWIDVSSEVGRGSCFKIYLPRIEGGEAVPDDDPPSGPAGVATETLLLVEDQEEVRNFTKTVLKMLGYHVLEAADGDEALGVAEAYKGTIHLLLTDVILPGMNGKELAEHLRAVRHNLKVLFTSGYTADVIAVRGGLRQGTAYLPKPFTADALAEKIRAVMAEKPSPQP